MRGRRWKLELEIHVRDWSKKCEGMILSTSGTQFLTGVTIENVILMMIQGLEYEDLRFYEDKRKGRVGRNPRQFWIVDLHEDRWKDKVSRVPSDLLITCFPSAASKQRRPDLEEVEPSSGECTNFSKTRVQNKTIFISIMFFEKRTIGLFAYVLCVVVCYMFI